MEGKILAGPIPYDVEFQLYGKSGNIRTECNGITFMNLGTNIATIENVLPLNQNQSIPIEGNQGEILTRQLQVSFAGAGSNQLLVIRKYYI